MLANSDMNFAGFAARASILMLFCVCLLKNGWDPDKETAIGYKNILTEE